MPQIQKPRGSNGRAAGRFRVGPPSPDKLGAAQYTHPLGDATPCVTPCITESMRHVAALMTPRSGNGRRMTIHEVSMPAPPDRRQTRRTGWALVAVLAMMAGCDREAPAARSPPVAAPAPPQSKPTYTLLMTWMYGDQPPQTTQTVFHDQTACDQARDAAIAEGRRLALESIGDTSPAAAVTPPPPAPRRYIGRALLPSDDASPPPPATAPRSAPPKVAALCAATSTP